jgi:peptidoglycan hydrolase-like protein with peptidoglycan-binding domain
VTIVAMPTTDGRSGSRARTVAAALATVTVLATAAGAAIWARGAGTPPAARAATIPVATLAVTRTDLSTSRTLHGTLGYGDPRVVRGGREGIVTSLPRPGQVLRRNAVAYRVNDEPVPLFFGSPPLYRTLDRPGTVGRDVAMARRNLMSLGFATGEQPRVGEQVRLPADPPAAAGGEPGTTGESAGTPAATPAATPAGTPTGTPGRRVTIRDGDAVLTPALVRAVKRWQSDVGLPVDGVLEVGDLVVLPGPVRVAAVSAVVGDAATGELMSVTGTTKVVTSQIDASAAGSLRTGAKVTLRMPDGAESPGTVGAIATVATAPEGQQPGGEQQVALTIEPAGTAKLDGGEVEIKVRGETRAGVLAVPVNALLALREGGYALQLPDDTLVPVKTGLFAMGMVEVTGAGLREGLKVVTTS